MKTNEKPRPTFDEFVAQCHQTFSFLSEFGFTPAPLPKREFINEFQVLFTNGKLVVVIEGINWGYHTTIQFEDSAGVRVPLMLFVPFEQRKVHARPLADEPQQLVELHTAAQWVKEYCVDLLRGDMSRFYHYAAEWKRITGRDMSYQFAFSALGSATNHLYCVEAHLTMDWGQPRWSFTFSSTNKTQKIMTVDFGGKVQEDVGARW